MLEFYDLIAVLLHFCALGLLSFWILKQKYAGACFAFGEKLVAVSWFYEDRRLVTEMFQQLFFGLPLKNHAHICKIPQYPSAQTQFAQHD